MIEQTREKINHLLREWPTNGLRTAESLREAGISSALLSYYARRHWLEKAARAVYKRPGDKQSWQVALHLLQTEMALPIHAGGLTALEVQGYGQYVAERPVFLCAQAGTRLPAWFAEVAQVPVRFTASNLLSLAPADSLHTMTVAGYAITLSTPERAALEMLAHVPRHIGFTEVFDVIGGLVGLRLGLLQPLLEGCTSIKVKRLFLYCAREAGHAWYGGIDRSRIDLGSGKREIVKGGTLDKEFLITVAKQPYARQAQF